MTDIMAVAGALDAIVRARRTLAELGVVRSQRLIADFGEWFGCQLLGVELASSRTQAGWDIGTSNRRIQVKTHAKAATNRARRTTLNKDELDFDELLIIVLNEDYRIRSIYLIPHADVLRLAPLSRGKRLLEWRRLESYSVRAVKEVLVPLLHED